MKQKAGQRTKQSTRKGVKQAEKEKPKASGGVSLYFIVTMAVVCYTFLSLYLSASEIYELKKERSLISSLIEEEEQKQIEISSQKHYYESDSYIEKTAREQLGLVKPNNVIFIDRNSN